MTNHSAHLRDQIARLTRIADTLDLYHIGPATKGAREAWEAMIQEQVERLRDAGNDLEQLARI